MAQLFASTLFAVASALSITVCAHSLYRIVRHAIALFGEIAEMEASEWGSDK
ncbi:hypothetical protein GRI39_02125 [Altererythrobacter indicus]|uniref:Uncharacterized protein n=1 Tax=Altericroceibacterium indicum TaxID=374177 RepID=A0A845A535_9SPHN|nr:hypothetical protein [Altericroceibacterium indicum]MXP24844.1 hypothetical protein [Altericroceibacterium indicum]